MDIESLRNKIRNNYIGRLFLFLLSYIYYSLFLTKKKIYDFRIIKPKKFSRPIICVGNISTGGTGKTTFVISLSKNLSNSKIKHVIVTRGYKSNVRYNDIIDINDTNIDNMISNSNISDEARLIALSLRGKNVPVISCKNRKKSIEFAINNYSPDIVIMDDGFQNFSIYKDLSIAIINLNKIDDSILPYGNLRERYSGIKRADFVVLNHCELFDDKYIENSFNNLSKYNKKIIKASYKPIDFIDIITGEKIKLENLIWKDVAIFSGIGDNSQFKKIIESIKIKVKMSWQFTDHYKYTIQDLISINNIRGRLPLITTMKDAIKFYSIAQEIFKKEIYVMDVDVVGDIQLIISKIKKII